MEIINRSMEKRVQVHRDRFKRELNNEIVAQKMVDLVMTRPVIYLWEKGSIKVDISYWDWNNQTSITFHIEEMDLETFIEGILGPLHRRKGINWTLRLDGEEDDPTFVYTPIERFENIVLVFRVKEGQFKSCRITKTVKKIYHHEASQSTTYNYEMECI